MRIHTPIRAEPALPPKSSDASYLSFTSQLWESAPVRPDDEVRLEGTIVSAVSHWRVRHLGQELGSGWSGVVHLRTDEGRVIELLVDQAVVTGGRHWAWIESWEVFCRDEPAIAATMAAPSPASMVAIDAWLLAAGERVLVRGVPVAKTRIGGYRDAACASAFEVRVLLSRAEPEPTVPRYTEWAMTPLPAWRRVVRCIGGCLGVLAFLAALLVLEVGLLLALRALLSALGIQG